MKVFIIEDELLAIERLRYLFQEYDTAISIVGTADSVSKAVRWLSTHPEPDLVVVDIELADGRSFSIFHEIKINCPILFTTAYDQYALQAFKHFSIDYLLKPVTLPALAASLQKYSTMVTFGNASAKFPALAASLSNTCQSYKQRFLVKVGSRMFFIHSDKIAWFYADNKNVYLVDQEGYRYLVDYTLDNVQELMDPQCFFRLNRRILCHINAIREIKSSPQYRVKIFLQAAAQKEEVLVSRERVTAFKQWADV